MGLVMAWYIYLGMNMIELAEYACHLEWSE